MIVFAFTVVLNFNMMMNTFQAGSSTGGRTVIGCINAGLTGLTGVEKWGVSLSAIVVLGNLMVFVYATVSELPLALRKSRRARRAVRYGAGTGARVKIVVWKPMLGYLGCVGVYVMLCGVYDASGNSEGGYEAYVKWGLVVFGSSFPFCLRASLRAPSAKTLNLFIDIWDALMPVPFLMSAFQLCVSLVGLAYPFVFTFLLLDAGNMSKSLQLCFRAIIIPFKQLLLTIMFFVIVIAVYTSVAIHSFGVAGYKGGGEEDHLQCQVGGGGGGGGGALRCGESSEGSARRGERPARGAPGSGGTGCAVGGAVCERVSQSGRL